MQFFLLFFLVYFPFSVYAQNNLVLKIADQESGNPLAGASVQLKKSSRITISDISGVAKFENLPAGKTNLKISFVGFESQSLTIEMPSSDTLFAFLEPSEEELEEISISSTRSTRTISDEPTRVEVIAGEELDEKSTMKPGELRMMLTESTGIQTQTTSAASGNASIRIQGLDGRYTQLLRDGFPVFSGASAGLGLLQIPPVDLKQVEVIKGSSSTLHGGGAIAGLVNLISKTPNVKPETSFLLNGTSAKGLDASFFQSRKTNKIGYTIFVSSNSSQAYDPAEIGLSAIPQFNRYTIAPRIFFYPNKNFTFNAGLSYTHELRDGGTMDGLNTSFPLLKESVLSPFYERNRTKRTVFTSGADWNLSPKNSLHAKGSFSTFNREVETPTTVFSGLQEASFAELSHNFTSGETDVVSGLNFWSDIFTETFKYSPGIPRNYTQQTVGAFTQITRSFSEKYA